MNIQINGQQIAQIFCALAAAFIIFMLGAIYGYMDCFETVMTALEKYR